MLSCLHDAWLKKKKKNQCVFMFTAVRKVRLNIDQSFAAGTFGGSSLFGKLVPNVGDLKQIKANCR